MQVQVTADFSKLIAKLDGFERRQAPYAMAQALNKTARDVQQKLRADLPSIFDRPAPFTMNSLATGFATTRGAGRMESRVFVKDLQAKYLLPEQLGGARLPSNNTRKPAAALVLPGPAMKLDRYGGIPRGTLARLQKAADQMKQARLAWRNAPHRPGARRPPAWPRDFGVFYWKHPNGLWAEGGGGFFIRQEDHFLKRLTAFKGETHYQPRLDFIGRAGRHAKVSFEANWRAALKEAMATAR